MKDLEKDASAFGKYRDLTQLSDDDLLMMQQEVAEEIQLGTYPLHVAIRQLCAMTLEWSARQQRVGSLSKENIARVSLAREVVDTLHLADNHVAQGDSEQALHCIATASGIFFTAGFAATKEKRKRSLDKVNKEKELLQETAKKLARSLWAADSDKDLLIGYVAQLVLDQMKADQPDGKLPENSDAVRDWIKSVAPGYARKGGRPKK